MKLTPELLAAAYEMLRATAPFNRWHLPPSADVRFKISATLREYGRCNTDWFTGEFAKTRRFTISVSKKSVQTPERLLRTMAHEMIHILQEAGRPVEYPDV